MSSKKIETTQAPAETAKKKPTRAELELVLKQVQDLVRKDPAKAAIILTSWIHSQNVKKAA